MRKIFGRWLRVGMRVMSPLPHLKSWAVKLATLAAFLGYGAALKILWGWVNAGYTHKVFASTPALFLLMAIALYFYQKEIDERNEKFKLEIVDPKAIIRPVVVRAPGSEIHDALDLSFNLEIRSRSDKDTYVQLPEVELFCKMPGRLHFQSWRAGPDLSGRLFCQWKARGERTGVPWHSGDQKIPAMRQMVVGFGYLHEGHSSLLNRTLKLRVKLDIGESQPRIVEEKLTATAQVPLRPH